MKRLTLLTAVVSVMMLGASVSAHADHKDRERREKDESHRSQTQKPWDDDYGYNRDTVYDGRGSRRVAAPQACKMAREDEMKLRAMRSRKIHLQQQYEYQLRRYGWHFARHTYYQMVRVDRQIRAQRMHVWEMNQQCELAKRRHHHHDHNRYGWSDGYYQYGYRTAF